MNTKDAPVSFTVDLIGTTGGVVTSTDGDTSYPSGNPPVHPAISTTTMGPARITEIEAWE